MPTEYRITDPSQLAVVLRSFRRDRKLTQARAAERLGVVQQSYARMESQPAATSVSSLMKMLGALGVDLVLRDRTAIAGNGQAAPDRPEETAPAGQQSRDAPENAGKGADTPAGKPARRVRAVPDASGTRTGDVQIRTGEILPLKSRKDW